MAMLRLAMTGEDLNKSDSDKVLSNKLGVVIIKNDDLDILYTA
jgi:hypothetical protein